MRIFYLGGDDSEGQAGVVDGVQAYKSNPRTRMIAPATKPVGREDPAPRYGSGNVKTYTAIGTANVVFHYKRRSNEKTVKM